MSLPKSIKIGYATFFDHIHTPELLRAHSAQLFNWIAEGNLKVRHCLRRVAQYRRDRRLASRPGRLRCGADLRLAGCGNSLLKTSET
jgi:hypothetical protein